MTIPNLSTSDSFKTWFDRTNTVISEVNGITIHDLRAGDGIGITSASNVFTVSHGSLVATGVTFSGPVKFTNSVAFSTSPTIDATVVTISPKSAGITIGNVVRMAGSGLTLAKADTAENAEVLGIVVNSAGNYDMVAVAGSVNNKNFNRTISNILNISGGTLGIGTPYFLDPVVAGGVTTIEPTTYKHVSKPVILGISGDLGSIIPYRGVEIDGISAGITAELDNKVIVEVDYGDVVDGLFFFNMFGTDASSVKVGDPFFVFTAENQGLLENIMATGSLSFAWKVAGKLNGSSITCCGTWDPDQASMVTGLFSSNAFLGWISKIINDDPATRKVILEITLPGGSFDADINSLPNYWPTINKPGSLGIVPINFGEGTIVDLEYLNERNFPTTGDLIEREKLFDVIPIDANTVKIIVAPNNLRLTANQYTNLVETVRLGTIDLTYRENLLLNGKFRIRQRVTKDPNTGLGFTGGVYYDRDVNKPFTPFVADRWFIVKPPEMTGVTLTWVVQNSTNFYDPTARQLATRNSIGNTTYAQQQYGIAFKVAYTAPGVSGYSGLKAPRLRLENIMLSPYNGRNQQATLKFNAKSDVAGTPLKVITNFYTLYGMSPTNGRFGGYVPGVTGLSGDIYTRSHWSSSGFTTTASPVTPANWVKNTFNGGVTLTTSDAVYTVPVLLGSADNYITPSGTPINRSAVINTSNLDLGSNNYWYSVGFEFENLPTVTVSITDVQLLEGWPPQTFQIKDRSTDEEHNLCKRYFQTSYYWDLPLRYDYRFGGLQDISYTEIVLGNLAVDRAYKVYFPVDMWRPPSSFSIYSWENGTTGEAYNFSKQADTHLQGLGSLNQTNLPWNPTETRPSPLAQGSNLIPTGVTGTNWAELEVNGGCVSLDKLRLHWVADSDFNPPLQ